MSYNKFTLNNLALLPMAPEHSVFVFGCFYAGLRSA